MGGKGYWRDQFVAAGDTLVVDTQAIVDQSVAATLGSHALVVLIQRYAVSGGGGAALPNYDSGPAVMPTVEAPLTAIDTLVSVMLITNLTAQNQTFSVKDNQGTPFGYLNGFIIPPGSIMTLSLSGMLFKGGIRTVATNANAVGIQVVGNQ